MSILNNECDLINILPVQIWLDTYTQIRGMHYEIYHDSESDITLVNVLSDKQGPAYIGFKSAAPNIPVNLFRFNLVEGTMYLRELDFDTLDGMPSIITGGLQIYDCRKLKNLIGIPKEIGGDFSCLSCNNITEFTTLPEFIGGTFECRNCFNLENARYMSVFGNFSFQNCPKLKYLPQFPKYFAGYIDIQNCGSLNVREIILLPDVIDGNLYLKDMKFELEKVGLSEIKTDVKQVKDQNRIDYAIPFAGVGVIFKDKNNVIIKYIQVKGDIYDNIYDI